jgi:glutaredoxin
VPRDEGDEVVVRVPRGFVAAGVAIGLAAAAFAWSRVTPDTSFFSRVFPASPVASVTQPATDVDSPRPGGATEQTAPLQATSTAEPAMIQPTQALAAPAATTSDDSVSATRRAVNQLEEKRERLARARRNVPITMYSTSWCRVCKDARRYLSESGVVYEDYDVDADRDADQRLRALNPRHTVPTFDIDGSVLTGFSPGAFESMLTSVAVKRASRD